MVADEHKIEEQKKKGGRTKRPPFIMYVRSCVAAQPDKP